MREPMENLERRDPGSDTGRDSERDHKKEPGRDLGRDPGNDMDLCIWGWYW